MPSFAGIGGPPPPPPYEDLSLWIEEWDDENRLLVNPNTRENYAGVNGSYYGLLRKARAFPADYSIDFDVRITAHRWNYFETYFCLAVMNNPAIWLATYLGGALVCGIQEVGPIRLGLSQCNPSVDWVPVTVIFSNPINEGQTYYCTLTRTAGTLRLYIYTDSGRTTLFQTLTHGTVKTDAGSQIFAALGGYTEEVGWISGYTENILIS